MVERCIGMGVIGIESFKVVVEADITRGLPSFDIVGLPDIAVKESRGRVRAAMSNSGFDFPVGKITINLAPAHVKKAGPLYDLPIFMSLLMLSGQLSANISDSVFIGELSLSGEINKVNGILPMTIEAKNLGYKKIYVPYENKEEAAVVRGIIVYPVKNVKELYNHLTGMKPIKPEAYKKVELNTKKFPLDYSQVKGQYEAKRVMEIAAAGGHNVLLVGPPGSGKSMLAQRLATILPDMTFEETIETTKIHSISGTLPEGEPLITSRPFRAPHHTISQAGLTGGGTIPTPGEISLAHNGVLFLDELPEFSKSTLEVLRQPLEDGTVTISRVNATCTYPCSIMLVCAMNPCPCGYYGTNIRPCTCGKGVVSKYLNKVSGPLLDRIDIHVEVPAVKYIEISSSVEAESSSQIRQRVNKARKIQNERYIDTGIASNARIPAGKINNYCVLDSNANVMLERYYEKLALSSRAYSKILKISRTIADLDNSEIIKSNHISEAIHYRSLDRKYWNK